MMTFKPMTGGERTMLGRLIMKAAMQVDRQEPEKRQFLEEHGRLVVSGGAADLRELWSFFSPSGDWERLAPRNTGNRALGEAVYGRLNALWVENDFPVFEEV